MSFGRCHHLYCDKNCKHFLGNKAKGFTFKSLPLALRDEGSLVNATFSLAFTVHAPVFLPASNINDPLAFYGFDEADSYDNNTVFEPRTRFHTFLLSFLRSPFSSFRCVIAQRESSVRPSVCRLVRLYPSIRVSVMPL